jgi:hypothetical protein
MWVMRVVDDSFYSEEGKVQHMMALIAGKLPMRYLKAFDANAMGGMGTITLTNDPREARQFESIEAVLTCWKTVSDVMPWRPDGKPNRPLTAYTIQPQEVPDEADPLQQRAGAPG